MVTVQPDYEKLMEQLCDECPCIKIVRDRSGDFGQAMTPDEHRCPAGDVGCGEVLWSEDEQGFYCNERGSN